VSAPPALVCFEVGAMIARYMAANPRVTIELDSTSRRVDVIGEGIDVAIRVRFPPLEQTDLVMRTLGDSPQRLVASAGLVKGLSLPLVPADLSALPSLDVGPMQARHVWQLAGPDGASVRITHTPRLVTDDLSQLLHAALEGVGAVKLPTMVVDEHIASGRLADVVPGWAAQSGIVHAVFPSRRGLLPSVRSLIDFLAAEYSQIRANRAPEPEQGSRGK
jgi:DNA-binding transcriptional LysR family regulator